MYTAATPNNLHDLGIDSRGIHRGACVCGNCDAYERPPNGKLINANLTVRI